MQTPPSGYFLFIRRKNVKAFLFFCFILWIIPIAGAQDLTSHISIEAADILKAFWDRVDEGMVVVGGKILTRADLEPLKVVVEQPLVPMFPAAIIPKDKAVAFLEERQKEIEAGGGLELIVSVYAKFNGEV